MIKDLGLFSWRIGLVLIFVLPMLYVIGFVAPFAIKDVGHPVVQFVLGAQTVVPSVCLTIAFGCALCLLVRIEMHLRTNRKDA